MNKFLQLSTLLSILSCLKNSHLKDVHKVLDNSSKEYTAAKNKDYGDKVSPKDEFKNDLSLVENNIKTPLVITLAKRGYKDLLKLLVQNGANIEVQDEIGNNALITASYYDNIEVVKELIKNKVNIESKNNEGFTALLTAIQQNNINVAKLLIEEGADIDAIASKQENALTIALDKGYFDISNRGIINLILDKGFDINRSNSKGETSIFISSPSMNEDVFRTLLEKGADIEHLNKKGETCLIHLCKNDNINLLKILLNFNPKLNTQDNEGKSALYYALRSSSEDIANIIISKGASLVKCEKNLPLSGIDYIIKKYRKFKEELEFKSYRDDYFVQLNNECLYGIQLRHCLSGYYERDEINFTKLAVKCNCLLELIQEYYPIDFLIKEIRTKASKISNNLKFEVLLSMLKIRERKVEESEFKSVLFRKLKKLRELLVNEFILNEKHNEEKVKNFIKVLICELLQIQ